MRPGLNWTPATVDPEFDKGRTDGAGGRVQVFDSGRIIDAREEAIEEPLPHRLTAAAEADLAELWADLAVETSEAVPSSFLGKQEAASDP